MDTSIRTQLSASGNQTLGRLGEDIVAAYLESLGWTILDRRWRCRAGEIDIIALDDAAEEHTVVFVEVKTRKSVRAGHPLEHVGYHKLRTLQGLAVRWLGEQAEWIPKFRIDVIGVVAPYSERPEITHVRNAQ